MTLAVIKNQKTEARQECAKMLRDLADQAERGEIDSFFGIVEIGAGYAVVGSTSLSRLQTVGALFECATDRLKV
jgi:hypothetical protein